MRLLLQFESCKDPTKASELPVSGKLRSAEDAVELTGNGEECGTGPGDLLGFGQRDILVVAAMLSLPLHDRVEKSVM